MKISIIIPVYNEQTNLVKRLSFLCEQANKFPLEIIIVNSPESIDESKMICDTYKNANYFESVKKGRASQMNFGAEKANGDILLFLHADVSLPNNFYNEVVNAVKKGNKAGFFAYKFDKERFLLKLNSSFTKKDGWFAGGGDQCHFFTNSTFKKLGGYNNFFCIMEDFEMMDRIRNQKVPFTIIKSKAIVSARKYDQNSWLKVNLINAYVFLKYKFGVHPKKLRKSYKNLLRESV